MTQKQLGPWFDTAVCLAAADPANSVILITRDGELAGGDPRFTFAILTDHPGEKYDALHCKRTKPTDGRGVEWDAVAGCQRLRAEPKAVLAINRALHTRLDELKAGRTDKMQLDCAEVKIG
jgi:hypothetical protein